MNKKTIGIVIATVAGAAVVAAGGIEISKYVSHQETEHGIRDFESSAREKFKSFRDNNIANINSLNDDHYMKKSFRAVSRFVSNPNATQLVGEFVKVGNEPSHWEFKNPKDDNKSGKDGNTILKNWEAVDKFVDEAKTFFEKYTTSSSKKSKKVESREDSANPGQAALPTETEQQITTLDTTSGQKLSETLEKDRSQEGATNSEQSALLAEVRQQNATPNATAAGQELSKTPEEADPQEGEMSKKAEEDERQATIPGATDEQKLHEAFGEDRLQGDPTSFVRDVLPAEGGRQIAAPRATAGQALSKTPEGTEPQEKEAFKEAEGDEQQHQSLGATVSVPTILGASYVSKVNVARYLFEDEKINDLAKQWKNTYRTPVRAIKWHSGLCWLHASILLFFHERHYNELIRKFPIEKAQQLISDRNLSKRDKACLEFMICLSKIFNILMGDPDVLAECVDLSKTGLEEELIKKYEIACEHPTSSSMIPEKIRNIIFYISEKFKSNLNLEKLHKNLAIYSPLISFISHGDIITFQKNREVVAKCTGHCFIQLFVDSDNILTLGEGTDFENAIQCKPGKQEIKPEEGDQFELS